MAIIELEVKGKKRRGNPNNRIKYYREKYNYTQADLGKKLGVSAKTISFWETGERDIGCMYIIQIMEIFDTSFEDLMCLEKDYNRMKEVNTSGISAKAVLRLNLFWMIFDNPMDKIRICIIDDEEYFLKAAESLLSSLSEELNTCIDTHFFQSIKNTTAMNYDMYFIDIQMPDANGFELSHNIYSESTERLFLYLQLKNMFFLPIRIMLMIL